ncbi:hypothetical protein AB6E53_02440 [Vibrio breoganii]|uniref:hypothetical protein n=1 Tax=Vibrio breoganii TaxID=553239 RepID=UPI0012FFE906|nr:hypothetical protein [Vibrio breoganii]
MQDDFIAFAIEEMANQLNVSTTTVLAMIESEIDFAPMLNQAPELIQQEAKS